VPVDPSLDLLRAAAAELRPLLGQLTFVGGATVATYLVGSSKAGLRQTMDVDAVVEVNLRGLQKIEAELRKLGFQPDPETTFRHKKGDLIVDLLPTDEKLLGFSNRWYKAGVANAQPLDLGDGLIVRTFDFPHFLASKLEAFAGRGGGDYYGSKDMEDIIVALEGRRGFIRELEGAAPALVTYLREALQRHLAVAEFRQGIDGHITRGADLAGRARRLLADIAAFAGEPQ